MLKKPNNAVAPVDAFALKAIESMWIFHTLRAVTRFKIANLLQDAPLSLQELAQKTETKPLFLFRVLRALTSIDVFTCINPEEEEVLLRRFANTPSSQMLIAGASESVYPLFNLFSRDWQQNAWRELENSLSTGKPGHYLRTEQTPWEYLQANPEEVPAFQEGMTWFRQHTDPLILATYPDFDQIDHLVDLGGGQGTFLTHVLENYPEVTGTLFDLSSIIEQAQASLAVVPAAITERLTLVEGSFFEAKTLPRGKKCYSLGQILQDWDDQHCVDILSNIRSVIDVSGRVLIMEPVIFPDQLDSYSAFFDVQMMVALEGRNRTPAEHETLLKRAGFRLSRVFKTAGIYSIVEGLPV